jgi:diguanylate cyclase (GGDEF)-like protein
LGLGVEVLMMNTSEHTNPIDRQATTANTAATPTVRRQVPRPLLRSWLIACLAAATVAQLSIAVVPGTHLTGTFLASCGVLAVAIGSAVLLLRTGASSGVQRLWPCAYLISLALLLRSQGSLSAGLQPLVLLPIVWMALYHRPRESAMVVLTAVGVLAVMSSLAHVPAGVIVRSAGLWGLAGAIVILSIHSLRGWLGNALDEREEALRQARVLGEVARELNSTLDPQQVIAVALRLAAEIASPPGLRARRANYCHIADGLVEVVAEFDAEGEWVGAKWPLSEHAHLARAVRTREPTMGALDQLGPAVRQVNRSQGIAHGGWVPVIVDGDLHGVLAVAGRNRPVSQQELSRCIAIVGIMELALTNALAHERLREAAFTDPLTSLPNRRGLGRLVRERLGRRPFAVLAIDVDGLKQVNDGHGHAAGDELLLLVANAISSTLRTGDVVARVGGDEFICVILDADTDAGAHVAARMLTTVTNAQPRDSWMPRVSIGVASATPGAPLDLSIRRADAAMYEAKRAGGMRFTVAGHETPSGMTHPTRRPHASTSAPQALMR